MNLKSMVSAAIITLLFLSACKPSAGEQHELPPFGEHLPEGYQLVYETDFSDDGIFAEFEFTDPKTWRRVEDENGTYLELFKGIGDYTPEVRSPRSFALLTALTVGDFVLDVDVESTNVGAGAHRDTCYFFGFQNPSNFYYVHIAKAADPNAHNIFRVQDAPRTNIATFTTSGVDWGVGIRHRVRIARSVEDGLIRVSFNDMENHIMETRDTAFDWGHVGIGSFDDSCRFYNLKLYAPEAKESSGSFFEKKVPDVEPDTP